MGELNALRLERHELSYGLEDTDVSEKDASSSFAVAKDFLDVVNNINKP